MKSTAELFGLTEYDEELVDRVIMYRLKKEPSGEYLTVAEIAEREGCTEEDVDKILGYTAIIWCH